MHPTSFRIFQFTIHLLKIRQQNIIHLHSSTFIVFLTTTSAPASICSDCPAKIPHLDAALEFGLFSSTPNPYKTTMYKFNLLNEDLY